MLGIKQNNKSKLKKKKLEATNEPDRFKATNESDRFHPT